MPQPIPQTPVTGTAADLAGFRPDVGQLVHATDTGSWYVGDGSSVVVNITPQESGGAAPDWIVGGVPAADTAAVALNAGVLTMLSESPDKAVQMTDAAAFAAGTGSGNNLAWRSGSSDGGADQGIYASVGENGAHWLEFMGDGILKVDGVAFVVQTAFAALEARVTALETP